MLKFLLGVVVGAILVVVVGILILAGLASLRSRPPAVAQDSTLVLHLTGDLPERPPVDLPFDGFGQRTELTVQQVWSELKRAAADSRIRAVVIEPQRLSIGWAKMQELHAELEEFRKSGKPLYAYLKTPNTRDYYVATAATRIFMGPQDLLDLKGVRLELMYFRKTLDKLGIVVDVEHDGKYKDFGDMFTRTDMSPETSEVMNGIADRVYGDLVKVISTSRGKTTQEIEDAIDHGPLLSNAVAARGLVDALCYEDEMFGRLKNRIGVRILKVGEHTYARTADTGGTAGSAAKIGFVVAQGGITRGDPDSDGDMDDIQAESFVKLLQRVESVPDLKGVIVRIDSPGGEVYATDAIWREMNALAKKKPVVISMSDAAASGGYYMAMNGSPIIAYPETLTGSIGVVFGKPDLHGLYDKLGITKDGVQRGRFAGIESDYKPLTPEEKQKLKQGIDETYQTFLKRVSDARRRPVEQIAPVAEGRVWLGEEAREKGLVDALGGIDRAIELVKVKANLAASSKITLAVYPEQRSLFDVLFSRSSQATMVGKIRAAIGLPAQIGLARTLDSPQVRSFLRGGFLTVCPWVWSID